MLNRLKQLSKSIIKRNVNLVNIDVSELNVLKNMAKLTTGTGISKIFTIAAAPILTRIYTPEHFGLLAVFTALIALILPFGTLRYSLAIPLVKNDSIAVNLVILCLTILSVIVAILFILFGFFTEQILSFFNSIQLLNYWWIIPIGILGTGVYDIFSNWAIREKSFNTISKTIILQSLVGSILKVIFGVIGLKPLGLIIGQVFKQAGGIILLMRSFIVKLENHIKQINVKRINFLFNYFSEFPKYRLLAQILLSISSKMPLLFFAWYYDVSLTGQLGLAFSMVAIPMKLFGNTTAKAYYAEIAKLGRKNNSKIHSLTKNLTKRLFLVGFLPAIILLIGGPWIFGFVFGNEWTNAGKFASILSIYLFSQFVYSPIGNGIFNVIGKQSTILIINFIRILIVLTVFLFSYYNSVNAYYTITMYSIALAIYYLLTVVYIFRLTKSKNSYDQKS